MYKRPALSMFLTLVGCAGLCSAIALASPGADSAHRHRKQIDYAEPKAAHNANTSSKAITPSPAPSTAIKPATSSTGKSSTDLTISPADSAAVISDLRTRHLLFPIKNFDVSKIRGSFNETRGAERHGASDILAPRNTPVMAIDDGVVAKLFLSRFGGITVYQFDPQRKFVYYYAHLEKYADGLKDGEKLHKGQVIGYVGTSGDAPKNTPHLHLCISIPTAEKKWWQTAPIDPYEVFRP